LTSQRENLGVFCRILSPESYFISISKPKLGKKVTNKRNIRNYKR